MLFNLLTEDEQKQINCAIEDWVDEHVGDSNCYERLPLPSILHPWETAKEKNLYKLLGENLILSKNFVYEKSFGELRDEIYRMKDFHAFPRKFREAIYSGLYCLSNDTQWMLNLLLDPDYLVDNSYSGTPFSVIDPKTEKPYYIKKGCKIMKVLHKICEMYNIDMESFEAFRIKHSQILNAKKLTGELHLSIHPLDYITMSDNECGWASCMSWLNGGEFAQGTVEMMNSACVVVAYLTAKDNVNFYGGEWNNKKWRELFIVTENVISEILPYPYRNDSLTKAVLGWLRELAKQNLNWEYKNDLFTYIAEDEEYVIEDTDYHIYFSTNYMYNDFRSQHLMYISPHLRNNITIDYSGPSECMWCGDTHICIDDESRLVCECCTGGWRCEHCGARIYYEEDMNSIDGLILCHDCYDTRVKNCVNCGEPHYIDELIPIYIVKEDESQIVNPSLDSYALPYICNDCSWEDFKKQFLNPDGEIYMYVFSPWTRPKYCIKVNDLSEEGKKMYFGDYCYNRPEYISEEYLFRNNWACDNSVGKISVIALH